MMLLPIPSYEIMVGFVLPSSSNAEDYEITNKIEGWFRANNNTATIKPQ
jgi:hypothetical protein